MSESTHSAAPFVTTDMSGAVCWLTLNRAEQRNPLSSNMIRAISAAIESAGNDPMVRVVVITGSGSVFSAGHDLAEMNGPVPQAMTSREEHLGSILDLCSDMMLSIMRCPKAVIACVQGTATAAGCQLVSACDLALASNEVRFCTPGVNNGSFCTTPLVGIGRNVHRKHAMEMALTGDMICAEDAVRMGLINKAVQAAELRTEVEELAQRIAKKSVQGIRSGKEAFYRQVDLPIEEAFDFARDEMIKALTTPDAKEGMQAFFAKRKPQWNDA
jgi:enoyl-CoA hydratase/carnithine racemase